jgi:hypothetical protein
MIAIAQADPRLREELFRETSRKMGVNEAIIEKDFWVCVILHLLFTSERWKDKLIFKGGTSLSKVYCLIERFSEDIDMILDWRELGFSDTDPFILEIRPLAEWTPNQTGVLSPYVVRFFAERFTIPETKVTVVTAERTFWEKATILHQEYYRPTDKVTPKRYSRHYYDLYKMGLSDCADSAIEQIDLLPKVVTFKERFYRAPWSNLINAKLGSIHYRSQHRKLSPEKDLFRQRAGRDFSYSKFSNNCR